MPADPAVETNGLHKRYDVHALRGVDLRVETGSVFGLLGPNGAGKTRCRASAAASGAGLLSRGARAVRAHVRS